MSAQFFPGGLSSMRVHLDECVNPLVRDLLADSGVTDVTDTNGAGLQSVSDAAQLRYCEREGRTLVTHDRLVSDRQYQGSTKPPVIFVPAQNGVANPIAVADAVGELLAQISLHLKLLRPYPESVTARQIVKRLKNRRRNKRRRSTPELT